MELHVNGSRLDNWHSLARANSADHELKCRERLERVCDILAVSQLARKIQMVLMKVLQKEKMACENVMAGTDAIRRLIIAPIASEKVLPLPFHSNRMQTNRLSIA